MRRLLVALIVVCLAVATGSSRGDAEAPATPAAAPDPLGYASIENGTLTDSRTGRVVRIDLIANESAQAGAGNVTLWLRPGVPGLPVRLCSTHGGNPGFPASTPFPGPGTQPLTTIECGNAGGQLVSVDGCRVTTTMHGVVHADAPFSPYSGTTTIDFSMTRNPGRGAYEGHITIHTPKEKIHLSGPIEGVIIHDTCG